VAHQCVLRDSLKCAGVTKCIKHLIKYTFYARATTYCQISRFFLYKTDKFVPHTKMISPGKLKLEFSNPYFIKFIEYFQIHNTRSEIFIYLFTNLFIYLFIHFQFIKRNSLMTSEFSGTGENNYLRDFQRGFRSKC
jgi:hypothetical protein